MGLPVGDEGPEHNINQVANYVSKDKEVWTKEFSVYFLVLADHVLLKRLKIVSPGYVSGYVSVLLPSYMTSFDKSSLLFSIIIIKSLSKRHLAFFT